MNGPDVLLLLKILLCKTPFLPDKQSTSYNIIKTNFLLNRLFWDTNVTMDLSIPVTSELLYAISPREMGYQGDFVQCPRKVKLSG